MIEIESICICDICKEKSEGSGIFKSFYPGVFIVSARFMESFYYGIPLGWGWLGEELLCFKCKNKAEIAIGLVHK